MCSFLLRQHDEVDRYGGLAYIIATHSVGKCLCFGHSGKVAPSIMTISRPQQTLLKMPNDVFLSPLCATCVKSPFKHKTREGGPKIHGNLKKIAIRGLFFVVGKRKAVAFR